MFQKRKRWKIVLKTHPYCPHAELKCLAYIKDGVVACGKCGYKDFLMDRERKKLLEEKEEQIDKGIDKIVRLRRENKLGKARKSFLNISEKEKSVYITTKNTWAVIADIRCLTENQLKILDKIVQDEIIRRALRK